MRLFLLALVCGWCGLQPLAPAEAQKIGPQQISIVALGASFTAGKGVASREAYPARLEALLRAQGKDVRVRNEGVDGDTTRDLLRRLDRAVPNGTRIVLFEFARGNDEKRGISGEETFENSEKLVDELLARKLEVLLIIRGRNPAQLHERMARVQDFAGLRSVPVVGIEQPPGTLLDGLHPTSAEHANIAARLAPMVEPLVERAQTSPQ